MPNDSHCPSALLPERTGPSRSRFSSLRGLALGLAVPGSLVALAVGFTGCAEELGPVRFQTASVSGRVSVGGRPLQRGWLEFLPVEGTIGPLRTAVIQADGSFAADGVAVGKNGVRVVGGLPPSMEGQFLSQGYYIRAEVQPEANAPMVIDLRVEAIRIQAEAAR